MQGYKKPDESIAADSSHIIHRDTFFLWFKSKETILLYHLSKSGFTLREPLFLMQGQLLKGGNNTNSANVRLVRDDNDISVCNEHCKSVYGFSREMELRQAKDQGVATMIERDGVITG